MMTARPTRYIEVGHVIQCMHGPCLNLCTGVPCQLCNRDYCTRHAASYWHTTTWQWVTRQYHQCEG